MCMCKHSYFKLVVQAYLIVLPCLEWCGTEKIWCKRITNYIYILCTVFFLSGMCVGVGKCTSCTVKYVHCLWWVNNVYNMWAVCGQFQIFRKLSQEPVHTAMPSSETPRQLTRLSWPASTPVRDHECEGLTFSLYWVRLRTKLIL